MKMKVSSNAYSSVFANAEGDRWAIFGKFDADDLRFRF